MVERNQGQDAGRDPSPGADRSGGGLPYLAELEPEVRAAAILDAEGNVVESAGSTTAGFGAAAAVLVESVDGAGGKPFDNCHIASAEAEIFIVREGDLTLVAVTERFVLASLMAFDMRMTLRDLKGGTGVA